MFEHAWHWITRSTRRAAPYWFCAKCAEEDNGSARPPLRGCPEE
jgi:hypothetical protein